jgi:hypothetical protein
MIVLSAAVSGETSGEHDTRIKRSRLVPSSSAFGGQRHAVERAEGLAERWREDAARARPHRRASFLCERWDGDECQRCTAGLSTTEINATTEGSTTHAQRILHFYSYAGVWSTPCQR